MGLVVELCGLPGSGKSVLAAHTCALLQRAGIEATVADLTISAASARAARVRRKTFAAAAAAATEPIGAARAVRAVAGTRPRPREGLGFVAQWLTVRRLTEQARARPGISLIEEGRLQTAWSMALRAPDQGRGATSLLRSTACAADLLVVVDSPLEVLLGRLDERPSRHSRTQQLAVQHRLPELERGKVLLDHLVAIVPCAQLVVCNDGSAPLEELAAGTADWVLRAG